MTVKLKEKYPSESPDCFVDFPIAFCVSWTPQGRDFHLRILLPEDLQLKNARLLCSWQLKTILNGYNQIVQQRMQHSPDLMSFMMELKMIL
uniref:E3 ubiquitin-protein ligase FANCL-like n=1 Tax=Castor canadensis TaxID=51338 RepID=A0A8B7UIP3_CASCN